MFQNKTGMFGNKTTATSRNDRAAALCVGISSFTETKTPLYQAMCDVAYYSDVKLKRRVCYCGSGSTEYTYESDHGESVIIIVPHNVINVAVRYYRFVRVIADFVRNSMHDGTRHTRRYTLFTILQDEEIKTKLDEEINEIRTVLATQSINRNSIFGADFDGDTISTTQRRNTMTPEIKNVIFNNPATIVFWSDGTKTVVKAENEGFDPEKGLAMAITKKVFGNEGNYYNKFKKWLPKESGSK
jgi:hypothetical protein